MNKTGFTLDLVAIAIIFFLQSNNRQNQRQLIPPSTYQSLGDRPFGRALRNFGSP